MNYLYHLFSDKGRKEAEDERIIVKVMQEKKNLPMKLNSPIKLSKLLGYYNIYWNQSVSSGDEIVKNK